jgi:polysaccharide deacetylase family protein (PEP-CTERM system associated)
LEDYFHTAPLSGVIPEKYWSRCEARVERNTLAALDLLDECGVKATFFTVGWLATRIEDLLVEIVRRGHEVASKGHHHRSPKQMTADEFREDLLRSREALERASGQQVRGYRIAHGSLTEKDLWVLNILTEEGFAYDSSFRRVGPKWNESPVRLGVHSHYWKGRQIWELPLSSAPMCGVFVPLSGGNYLRQPPYWLARWRIERWKASTDSPLVFYFRVWELDPEQPRIRAAPALSRIHQYRNLESMSERIRRILLNQSFTSAADYLRLSPLPASRPREEPVFATVAPRGRPAAQKQISVVIPCFNETSTLIYLKKTLESFADDHAHLFEIFFVFVDDGSSDDTWERLTELFGGRDDCALVRHPRNKGVAAATLTGIRHSPCEVVCVIDCDCSYDVYQLAEMVSLLRDDVDLVTASPYHEKGGVVNVPTWRLFLSRSLSALYRTVLSNKLATYTSCFRVYRRSAVMDADIKYDGFVGIAEILAQMDRRRACIVEYPAVLESRLFGHSKIKVMAAGWGHLRLLFTIFFNKLSPKNIFS